MKNVKDVSVDGTVAHQIGNMIVQTADVPARQQFLTVVLVNGKPFDLALSDTVEQAFREHQAFVDAALMLQGGGETALEALNRALLN